MAGYLSLKKLFVFILCCGFIFVLTGCRNASFKGRGIEGERPADAVSALIDRYKAGEDFMELCSAKLEEETVYGVMDKMTSPDWQYFVCEEKPQEFGVSVGENEYIVSFSGGETEKMDGGTVIDCTNQAYAIVAQDSKTRKYVIIGLYKLG